MQFEYWLLVWCVRGLTLAEGVVKDKTKRFFRLSNLEDPVSIPVFLGISESVVS